MTIVTTAVTLAMEDLFLQPDASDIIRRVCTLVPTTRWGADPARDCRTGAVTR